MGLIKMTVYPRATTGKNENRRTRAVGRTPAVIYGDKREQSLNVELDTVEFSRAMSAFSGSNPLFNMTMDGSDDSFVTVLREIQTHPVTDEIFHCDLFAIPLGKPLVMEVALDIHGENRLVRAGDAVLDVVRRSVEIECLPREVPDTFDIDFSELEIGDKISVADITLESGTMITDEEEIILKVNLNTYEEEVVEEEDEEGEEGEGVEGEDGEGAEGDDATPEDGSKED
jgi:large subunit ribosomal protein L25